MHFVTLAIKNSGWERVFEHGPDRRWCQPGLGRGGQACSV